MRLVVEKARRRIEGDLAVPASKYHLHRALILGSLAEGTTVIQGRSDCVHIADTLRSLSDLGVKVRRGKDSYEVVGRPYYRPRSGIVRVGSSGSTLQFLLGLGCLSRGRAVTYRGHHLLAKRPIGALLDALREMGVRWRSAGHCLPVRIFPGRPAGGTVRIRGLLSQWISGLLMLAPFAASETVIEMLPPFNERNYIRLTLEMMRRFGAEIHGRGSDNRWVVPPAQRYRACRVEVEADLSSAAFLLGLAALHPARLFLRGLGGGGTHPEGRILDIARRMGLPLRCDAANRAVAVEHDGVRLRGVEVDMRTIPDLIPVLSVMGAAASGRTVLRNIGPGRLKESNRVKAMLQLRRMGAAIEEVGDDLIIEGGRPLRGAALSSYNDHRVEMALALAGTAAAGRTEITYPNAYKISYPEFLDHMNAVGAPMRIASGFGQGGAH